MSANDTARALMAMDDAALRATVASGSFADLSHLDLDEHEQLLLRGSARSEDDDETETYGVGSFAPPYVPLGANLPLLNTIRYVEDNVSDPALRSQFTSWVGRIGAQGTW